MSIDPYEGTTMMDVSRGDRVSHPRFGEVEFYKYDRLREIVEVFDKYGIVHPLTMKEFMQCPRLKSRES